jgi:hypothetical protein
MKTLRSIVKKIDPRETDFGTSIELGTGAVLAAMLMRWLGS